MLILVDLVLALVIAPSANQRIRSGINSPETSLPFGTVEVETNVYVTKSIIDLASPIRRRPVCTK